MSETTVKTRVDAFFTVAEARSDRWRTLVNAANKWQASAAERAAERDDDRAAVKDCLAELRQWEDFFAYPGEALLRAVDDRVAAGDAAGTARLVQQISMALISRSYRDNASDWEAGDESPNVLAEVVKGLGQEGAAYRPYFEVLIVSPRAAAARAQTPQELRKLRRQQDRFVYESVVVGSFEDAVLGTILNGAIQAVIVYNSIPFATRPQQPRFEKGVERLSGCGCHQEGRGGLRAFAGPGH